jgi:murein DD-endopeptidase MepM/ murein hydrolase activator NlpD
MRGLRVLILIGAAALAGCVRSSPPAPVVYGHPPIQEARRTPSTEVPGRPAQPPVQATPNTITVQPGETVYTLSRKYGVSLRELIEANRLVPPFSLSPGQSLTLPGGEVHQVREGETIYGIARQYGIDARDLVRLNAIPPPYRVQAGRTLKLPPRLPSQVASSAPTAPAPTRAPVPAPLPQPERQASVPPSAGESAQPSFRLPDGLPDPEPEQPSASRPVPDATPSRGGTGFMWPVKGKVLAGFGSQGGGLHNDGINIAAPRGAPIYAAENGVVVYAGNELSGFGNLLILRHADGWMTAYGHIDAMRVHRGDTVRRGQVIATVGQTGGVTSPQLHFEIRKGSNPVDPSRYLAGSGSAAVTPSGASPGGRPGPG